MTDQATWLLIGLGAALPFVLWFWRRFDVRELSVTYDSAGPEEPCWTEEVRGADGLNYGRYGCFHENLHEMEKRARLGEFNTPV